MDSKNEWFDVTSNEYINALRFTANTHTEIYKRIEARTRKEDYNDALSLEIYDPLWMLSRQWQYGRFKAVSCGTPVSVKVKAVKKRFEHIFSKRDNNGIAQGKVFLPDTPLEYEVEKQNIEITPYVRVEAAMHLKQMLAASTQKKELIAAFLKDYPLEDIAATANDNSLDSLKFEKNQSLKDFYKFYGKRSFDGFLVYKAFVKNSNIKFIPNQSASSSQIIRNYAVWFAKKFYPCEGNINFWDIQKIGYEVGFKADSGVYQTADYDSGKLSWYTFDAEMHASSQNKDEVKMLSYIPTPANIPGAPSNRLWEIEDRKVNVGNNDNDFNFIGTAAIMQYITMYSNDWMITPLETETGTVLDVEGIIVKDSFGDRHYITKNAQDADNNADSKIYTDRWNLFGTSQKNAYKERNFSTDRGLLFPPTILRNEESKPLEEVQFLRDEMANMVWGVETTINNLCGGTMDGRTLSDAVLEEVDNANLKRAEAAAEEASESQKSVQDESDYSLLIQNRVPINWIPFIPQPIQGDCRNNVLRRGRMPIYYNGEYKAVTPSTELIGLKKENGKVVPLYLNEEELASCGVKVVKTAQRTRWFLGKSYNWIGNKEVISEYQANSGLMFDDLISKSTGKQISLGRTDIEQSENGEA